jgi:hypothetical protein
MHAAMFGELRNRDTGVMIEKFACARGSVRSEFLDLKHASNAYMPSVAYDCGVRSGNWQRRLANFAIGTLA